ncbi:MAG: ADP-ribosylglycohydrolase family protein [Desulfatiglandales bacterium]
MEDHLRAMLLGAFVGDSLALGVHWIYDLSILDREFGIVKEYLDPGPNSYHPTKKKGEFTHYGDQMLLLLESLAEEKGFDALSFSKKWRSFMEGYRGYRDQATLLTLQNLNQGVHFEKAGSPSNDFSGAVRSGILGYLYGPQPHLFERYAAIQTSLTHRDPDTILCSRFLARLLSQIIGGQSPLEAIKRLVSQDFSGTNLSLWVQEALSFQGTVREAVLRFGQSCHTPELFPGLISLIGRYEGDLEAAMIEAIMAGGDNATRASATGMILGLYHGTRSIPPRWIEGLSALRRIEELMEILKPLRSDGWGN